MVTEKMMATPEHNSRLSPSSNSPSPEQQSSSRNVSEQSLHIIVEPQPDGHTNMIHLINPPTGQILSSFLAEHGACIEIQPGVVFRVPFPQEHGYPSYPVQYPQTQQYPSPNLIPGPQVHHNHGNMNVMGPQCNPTCPVHGSPTHYNDYSQTNGDERLERRREKLQRKLREKQASQKNQCSCNCQKFGSNHLNFPQVPTQGQPRPHFQGKIGTAHHPQMNGPFTPDNTFTGLNSDEGQGKETEKEENEIAIVVSPKVEVVDARTVKVSWADCVANNSHLTSCLFELQMESKGSAYKTIYCGPEVQYTAMELCPATEYSFRICAVLDGKKGPHSEVVTAQTPSTVPDAPLPPRVTQKTKTSLLLKWSVPFDGGSPITSYRLQWDKGIQSHDFEDIFNGSQRQFKVSHKLPPSTPCHFRLQTSNALGSSPFSQILECLTSAGPPDVPDPPQLIKAGTTYLVLGWMEPANNGAPVTEYKLEMEDERSGYGFMVVYHGDHKQYTCRNLLRNTLYKFRLLAGNVQGHSKYSSIVAYATLPEAPGKIEKPRLVGKAKTNMFVVCWEPPKDTGGTEVTNYILEMCDKDGKFREVYRGLHTEYAAEGLRPGGTYKLRVVAEGQGGRGTPSQVAHIATLPVCPGKPDPPRLSKRHKPEPNMLSLEWDSPSYDGGSAISNYCVKMCKPLSQDFQDVFEGPKRYCDICGLEPGQNYRVKLQCFNKAGRSPWSDEAEISTAPGPPDPPSIPSAICKSPTHIRLEWMEPKTHGASVTGYVVEQLEDESFTKVFEGTSSFCEIKKGLHPATYYYHRVQALSEAGSSPFSVVCSVETPPAPPAVVSYVKVIDQTSESALLQWRHPHNHGCPIVNYLLEVTGVNTTVISVPIPLQKTRESFDEESEKDELSEDENVEDFVEEDNDSSETEQSTHSLKSDSEYMEFEVTGLLADTAYRIRIQPVNRVGPGPFSHAVQFVTKELPPSPPNLELISSSYQSLKLKWGESLSSRRNNFGISYTLQMKNKNGNFSTIYSGMGQSFSVSKLKELSSYMFRINAKNDAGEGQYSEPKTFTTKAQPPATIKDVKFKHISSVSAQISWSPVDLIRQDDSLCYVAQRLHVDHDKNFVEVYRGPHTNCTSDDLSPDEEFQYRICAIRTLSEHVRDLSPKTPEEIKGGFSSIARLKTQGAAKEDESTDEKMNESKGEETVKREFTDREVALMCLFGFLIVCFLIALILNFSIGY